MTDRSRNLTIAAAAATVFFGFSIWLLGGFSHGEALKIIDDVVLVAVSIPALITSALAARASRGRSRGAWSALALGLLAWTIGEILWAYWEIVLGEVAFPSIADAFFLLFPVGAGVALLLFRSRRSEWSNIRVLLDGFIVAGSLFIVSWLLVMSRVYEAGAATTFEFVLLMAYPVLDLVLLTMAAMALVSARAEQRVPMTLITLGLSAMALADSGYAYLAAQEEYYSGDLVDIGWVAGLLLLTLAATVRRPAPPDDRVADERPGLASVWLPYLPLMLAGLTLVASPTDPAASSLVPIVAIALAVTVLARQFLAVKENRQLIAAVADQALRDPLTGLANRALFQDRLTHAMQLRQRYGTAVGVMVLDLNGFKAINDNHGHSVGDELLNRVGGRILRNVWHGETVARLGGDEFAVMVEGDADQPGLVARQIMAAFDKPIALTEQELVIKPSVGLAIATARDDISAEDLLKRADLAMYTAKRSQTSEVQLFSSDLQFSGLLSGGAAEISLLNELRNAIDHSELALVYQPKVDLTTEVVVGVEALLRWRHPERGLIGPDEFLPLVRRHGLIGPISDFVINRALDDAQRWHQSGLTVPVAVNLFAPSLAELTLPDRIERALKARGLDGSALTVEITEDLFPNNIERMGSVVRELRSRGMHVAIDDFGSGYSALWCLRELPVDEVKLDRSLVAPITVDPRAAAVVRTVTDLARVLGLTTVAEGVENAATVDRLRAFGCDVGQGFYFSEPIEADGVVGLVSRRPAPTAARSS